MISWATWALQTQNFIIPIAEMRTALLLLLLCFLVAVLCHKHHDTEAEDNWWKSIIEYEGGGEGCGSNFFRF